METTVRKWGLIDQFQSMCDFFGDCVDDTLKLPLNSQKFITNLHKNQWNRKKSGETFDCYLFHQLILANSENYNFCK